jgi:hypothetical protein
MAGYLFFFSLKTSKLDKVENEVQRSNAEAEKNQDAFLFALPLHPVVSKHQRHVASPSIFPPNPTPENLEVHCIPRNMKHSRPRV